MIRILATGDKLLKQRFQIVRLISDKGGMAMVFMVHDLHDSPPSTWALKQLRPQHKSEEDILRLFDQEADMLKSLSHRNIPQYRMRFDEGGDAFLVLELITGKTLADVLAGQNRPAEQDRVLQWSAQICDVLNYLHTRKPPIIYRDLKPDNLMITDDGVVKVIDFGIARTFKKGKKKDTVSMGTEAYAPPEQWGSEQTDERSDIYALGATMYHLLTNSYPPHAKLPGTPTPITMVNPLVSQPVSDLVARAMEKERDRRFQSAADMKQAISKLLSASSSPSASSGVSTPTPPGTGWENQLKPGLSGPLPTPAPLQRPRQCPVCNGVCPPDARFCRFCGNSFTGVQRALLCLIRPYGATWEKPIPHDQTIVIGTTAGGGAPNLDLSFYDRDGYVSRRHARLSVSGNNYVLTDLGSTNGTKLNDRTLPPNVPTTLHNGDHIQLGSIVLQFRLI